jgi:hypothetical protein
MIAIHAGFLVYEAGASRVKNVLATALKSLMTLAVIVPSFFFFAGARVRCRRTGSEQGTRSPSVEFRPKIFVLPYRAADVRRTDPPLRASHPI